MLHLSTTVPSGHLQARNPRNMGQEHQNLKFWLQNCGRRHVFVTPQWIISVSVQIFKFNLHYLEMHDCKHYSWIIITQTCKCSQMILLLLCCHYVAYHQPSSIQFSTKSSLSITWLAGLMNIQVRATYRDRKIWMSILKQCHLILWFNTNFSQVKFFGCTSRIKFQRHFTTRTPRAPIWPRRANRKSPNVTLSDFFHPKMFNIFWV